MRVCICVWCVILCVLVYVDVQMCDAMHIPLAWVCIVVCASVCLCAIQYVRVHAWRLCAGMCVRPGCMWFSV